ncbi:hypothetical protein RJ639_013673 [Escallonia herrerae]|uniref:chalcone synthase n=1 Tax=Escallonia herrerae TaxID=1293975 RepID=A0AA88VLI8_9ASTE|nr:hypothetical protein RJ639_013673 [Escallonia herrerae]
MVIGTATPANCVDQSIYPDFYFGITNSEHKTNLRRSGQLWVVGWASQCVSVFKELGVIVCVKLTTNKMLVNLKLCPFQWSWITKKFLMMCISSEKSMIKKHYMLLTEEILKENPKIMALSIDARQDMVVVEVPKLGKEAATKAIKE